jgi:hypothetical protein
VGIYPVVVVLQEDRTEKCTSHNTLRKAQKITAHKATHTTKDTLHTMNTTQKSKASLQQAVEA